MDGVTYTGIDMTGFLPLLTGLEGKYTITKYCLLTVVSGLWLLVNLLWPASEGGETVVWISLVSFLLYVVTAHIHWLKGELKEALGGEEKKSL